MAHTTPPRDADFPRLDEILDAERLVRRLQQELERTQPGSRVARARVRRSYYRPGQACRILVEARLRTPQGDERTQLYFGEMHLPAALERAFRRAADVPGALLLRAESTILWPYPHDPYLPGLAVATDVRAMRRRLQKDPAQVGLRAGIEVGAIDVRLSKYVPGRRCGLTYRAGWRAAGAPETVHTFFGKIYAAGNGRSAYDVLQRIGASSACRDGHLHVPRVYGYDAGVEAVWQERVPGTPQTRLRDPEQLLRAAPRVAHALAALHASAPDLGPGKGMTEQIEQLRQAVRSIATACPEYGARCEVLSRKLQDASTRLPPIARALVHGSFKSGHILHEGDHVTVIDLDAAGFGDPMYDVGRYIARLEALALDSPLAAPALEACIAAFRHAYAERVPWGWPEPRARWYTSAHLVASQAYKNVKRLAPQQVQATLDRAETWLPAELRTPASHRS